jgi:hypothetical protein
MSQIPSRPTQSIISSSITTVAIAGEVKTTVPLTATPTTNTPTPTTTATATTVITTIVEKGETVKYVKEEESLVADNHHDHHRDGIDSREDELVDDNDDDDNNDDDNDNDFTRYPKLLDEKFDHLANTNTHTNTGHANAVRPCIINIGDNWTLQNVKKNFRKLIPKEIQNKYKNRAFELLDGLTRSGAIPLEEEAVTFHVMIGFNHQFDFSIMNSLIQQNINPIEQVEQSHLMMSTTLLSKSVHHLLR